MSVASSRLRLVLVDLDETLLATTELHEARHSGRDTDLSLHASYSTLRPQDGLVEALEELATQVRIGVVSSSARWYVEQILDDHFPSIDFSPVVTYDDVESIKPDPESLLLALELAGVEASDAVYIGDADVDHEACVRVGMPFLGAGWAQDPTYPPDSMVLALPSDLLRLVAEALA